MRITLFGATGRTGRRVAEYALAEGHEVTAYVRDPARLAMRPAPRAPAAGPERTVVIGWCTTSSAESTPPLLFMTENGIAAPPVNSSSRSWMLRARLRLLWIRSA